MTHRKGELSDAALDRNKQHPLILICANKSRGGDHWDVDDYDVRRGDDRCQRADVIMFD